MFSVLLFACTPSEPALPQINDIALRPATYELNQENWLINGKRITPAGVDVLVGTQPSRVLLTPDGTHALVNEATWGSFPRDGNRGTYFMRVVRLSDMTLTQTVLSPSTALWHGMDLLITDTTTLWATDGKENNVVSFALAATNYLTALSIIPLPDCYSADVAADARRRRLYVTCLASDSANLSGHVLRVDLAAGAATGSVAATSTNLPGAFHASLSPDGDTLYVASIATAALPEDGDLVWALDPDTLAVKKEIRVGWGPAGLTVAPGRNELYVPCNRSDDVYVIDLATNTVKTAISLHHRPAPLKGLYPVRAAVAPGEKTLFVTTSHENAIAVVDLEEREVKGFIPTGWYPNDVAVTPDGGTLVVSVGRGVGDGPNVLSAESSGEDVASPGLDTGSKHAATPTQDVHSQGLRTASFEDNSRPELTAPGRALRGSISKIAVPDAATLAAYTQQVEDNNNVQSLYFDFSRGNATPLPSPGAPTAASDKIRHVFFILKENFSYDAAFGDHETGNGDPAYVLWTEDVIPEQRKLAREYTLFDNFYCEADSSLDGHQWAAAGIETDYLEKVSWHAVHEQLGVPAVSLTPGTVPLSRFILPHLIDQGIDALGFGGLENFGIDAFGKYRENYIADFGWNTTPDRTDVARAEQFREELARLVSSNKVPAFSWIFLGNNHAFGLRIGEPIPEYWVGENDKAVGMVVEAISQSPIWEHSLIFITEDDAQSGLDHVDKHRCPALAIGPYVKRGYVSSVMYTINNFHKTVQLLLGSTPMHRLDERAIGMYDIFTIEPDFTPYQAVGRDVPRTLYTGGDEKLLAMSAAMDWTEIDKNPNAGEFYWRYRKGTAPPKRSVVYKYWRPAEDEDDEDSLHLRPSQ